MLDTLLKHLDMVRLSAGMVALVALVGCTGLIGSKGGGGGGLTPEQQVAQQKWLDEALPVLKQNCTSCHAVAEPTFLAGATDLAIRDTLMNFDPQIVNLDAPQSSQLLTKGSHNGPALLADQASALLDWINAEKDAAGVAGVEAPMLATAQFMPQLCTTGQAGDPTCPVNHVSLTDAGLPGAQIDLLIQQLSSGIYVTDLALTTATVDTGGQGAYIEHPLFVSWPPPNPDGSAVTPIPDNLDRFYNVKMNLMPAMSQPIGGGLGVFEGFPPGNLLQIQFKVVDKYRMDDGGGGGGTAGGCKVLDSFKTNAVPLMTAAGSCSSCHMGQNASATSAMDITGIDGADPTNACNQVRTRINFQDLNNSGVLLAPDPAGDGAHPFKLSGASNPTLTNYQNGMKAWMMAEATAP